MAKKITSANDRAIASVKMVGVGGGGGNAVSRMSRDFVRGIELIAINTDQQDLDQCQVKKKIYIGRNLTRGLGTGMNPDVGRQAAEENRSEIAEAVQGADLVFISAGFGGGTGTGASPVVAEVARQAGALTVAVVTKPFAFEGSHRERIAQEGISKMKDKVDALIVVPNDRIFSIISKETPILKAFQAIDEVLRNALKGIVELIVTPGIVNVDFADVKTIVEEAGSAIVGIGIASGPDRAIQAVNQALNSPLLEASAEGAHGVLLGISGGRDLRMTEVNEAARLVAQTVDPTARIIFGAYHDRNLKPNQIKITLIATGFSSNGTATPLFSGPFYEPKPSFFGGQKFPAGDEVQEHAKMAFEDREHERKAHKHEKPTMPPVAPAHREEKHAPKPEPRESKKKESDIWDIPAFLRKRRK